MDEETLRDDTNPNNEPDGPAIVQQEIPRTENNEGMDVEEIMAVMIEQLGGCGAR